MQTAVINYRVADFLKQYAPFQAMDEADLLALAARGRVKFHESDEFVFWQGTTQTPFLYVIQQGTVSLWEDSGERERLRDIRGTGEMLGLERFTGASGYLHSAKTNSDVVLYALPVADFEPLLFKYPQAARYVASYAAVNPDYQPHDPRRGPHQIYVHDTIRRSEASTCSESDTVREVALRMTQHRVQGVAVLNSDRRVSGVVTADGILRWLAKPGSDPDAAVAEVMECSPCVIAPQAAVSQCVLAMAEAGVEVVVSTGDGTAAGPFQGVIAASDVARVFGDQPLFLLREIRCASNFAALRALNDSLRAFLLGQLEAPASLDWLARLAHCADAAIVQRIVELTEKPADECCLCFYGASGRQECLTSVAPPVAVVHGSCSERNCSEWSRILYHAFVECGYLAVDRFLIECACIGDWKERFRAWIRDPVLSDINSARPLFDLNPVWGKTALWSRLRQFVRDEVRAEKRFVRILAHDCLSNLPPLTIFRDLVVEGTGERTATFQLERKALRPLVDVARVFGIAAASAIGGSTLERLGMARQMLPDHEAIFREAADTLRVVLYHQARAGIRTRGDGSELQPSLLSGHDRQALKTGFRSILRLLEFTAECRWLEQT